MKELTFGFASCGSFCTLSKAMEQMQFIAGEGYSILPIMSTNTYETDTRFGKAEDFIRKMEEVSGRKVIHTIAGAEPIGPKQMADLMIVAPCTGNTLAKLANGITDTPVTMAVKSMLRINRPVVLAAATNDALAASAQNIGKLMNTKNIYFVPMQQDDPEKKPSSLVCNFTLLFPTVQAALEGRQLQPILL